MTPSDAQVLHDFLGQLVQARGVKKDPEADALIQRAVELQPDAAYLLVQRVLLMEQALDSAKSRIATLENQLRQQPQQQEQGGGFLENVFGQRHQVAQPQSHAQPHHMSYQHAIPGATGNRAPGFLRGGGRGGGLLGSIAATAAGVAAGSFLFHGLDNLFHDHNGGQTAHLLDGGDLSGSALAEQAGLDDIGQADQLLDNEPGLDGSGGFFDGDGSDDGLFG